MADFLSRGSQEEDGTEERCNKTDEASLFYGKHEILEVSEGADVHKLLASCTKNPGHTNFVPVNNFNINHLPEGCHDNELFEYIKATADLTLMIAGKMVSPKRPEFYPNTNQPYPFYDKRGSYVTRLGTGMVSGVIKWTEKDNKGPCPCHKCQHSDTPIKVWGEVTMHTARHVVFDDLEARRTTCRLFFDDQDSPLVTLDGWREWLADSEEDKCVLKCDTCDVDLLDKLDTMWKDWMKVWSKVYNKYKSSRDNVKMILIVSHPHGCPKQISVGQWINKCTVNGVWTKYTYTTCTCPGSSGANVYSLGYEIGWAYYDRHVHSGVNSEGINYSTTGRDFSLPTRI